VQRLISRNVGIIFKGSGFYCTDHRSNTCLGGSDEKSTKTTAADGKAEAKAPDVKTTPDACSACRSEKTPASAVGKK
jgi:hypothetical protein